MKRVDINGEAFEQNTMNLPVNEVYKTDDQICLNSLNSIEMFFSRMKCWNKQRKGLSVQSSLTNTWWLSTDSIDWNTLKSRSTD